MYYIVETEQQLKNLHCAGKECYIRIIPMNDEYHSALTSPCLIYFKTLESKGYIQKRMFILLRFTQINRCKL